MRLLAVASVISVFAAAATFACTSSDPVTPAADAGKDAKASQTTDDDDSTPTDDTDAGDQIPVTDPDASTTDADATVVNPGTTDAGHNCSATSTAEIEPNDTEANATAVPEIAGPEVSFCGQVVTGDIDTFTFVTPDFGNQGFDITPSGDNVKWTFQIGNKTFDGIPNNFNTNVGDKWVVTVQTGSATARSYALRIH